MFMKYIDQIDKNSSKRKSRMLWDYKTFWRLTTRRIMEIFRGRVHSKTTQRMKIRRKLQRKQMESWKIFEDTEKMWRKWRTIVRVLNKFVKGERRRVGVFIDEEKEVYLIFLNLISKWWGVLNKFHQRDIFWDTRSRQQSAQSIRVPKIRLVNITFILRSTTQ